MGSSLIIHGAYDGYVVSCDGQVVAKAPTFLEACAALHRLRAIRAFAKEELAHVLSKREAA